MSSRFLWELHPEDEIPVPCNKLRLGDCVLLSGCDHISCPCSAEKWYIISEKVEDWPEWIALEYSGLGGHASRRVISRKSDAKLKTIKKPENIQYVVAPEEVRRILDKLGFQFVTWDFALYVPLGVGMEEWVNREAALWANARFMAKLSVDLGERKELASS